MSELMCVSTAAVGARSADVIFIHGIGGDPKATWHPTGKPNDFWPKWLAEDLPTVGVWSYRYSAPVLSFAGHMALADRALNALAYFETLASETRPSFSWRTV